jgi:FkbM family methyltransferase
VALSYTQNLEDYHLSLAFAGQESGTYIDIGAGHPIADNVSFWFYERGWQGVVVEPQPELLALYERLRPRDRRICALVGSQCGEADFHIVERLHGFSSMRPHAADSAKAFEVGCRTVRMAMTTLARLCADLHLDDIDFLKVDVEGAEADVLFGGDWQRFRPKAIVAEAVAPRTGEPAWEEWEPFLLAHGYRFALFDTLNRFYVAVEHPEIFARLPKQRAAWDSATHMYEVGRAPENKNHPDHALAQQLMRGFWASLPFLDRDLLAQMLARGHPSSGDIAQRYDLKSDQFTAALGRIACGYDGGQIVEE